jgi:RNA polymerase sigma-70 factor (ECF subfamily)
MKDDFGSSERNGRLGDELAHPDLLGSDAPTSRQWIQCAIDEHESSLLRYAHHFVHDLETARDVVQDTFLQLCKQTNDEIKDRVAQWLFTVCRNRAIDICRKEGRMKTAHENVLVDQVDPLQGPTAGIEKAEAAEGLVQQISRLPNNQQEVLRLKFHAGLSYKEIADVTGLSRTNVGFLLHKAIARLRERLTQIPIQQPET